jgi:hypothetical protein
MKLTDEGPIQFIREKQSMYFYYYMTKLTDSPCQICIVQLMCSKSVFKDTAFICRIYQQERKGSRKRGYMDLYMRKKKWRKNE